jgi:hypothetical protein
MRRYGTAVWHRLVVAAVLLAAGSAQAQAQGLLDFLFGGPPKSPPSQSMPQQKGLPGVLLTPGGQSYSAPSNLFPPRRLEDGEGGERSDGGTRYRTLCVRLCDGYYFPVSSSTTRRHFQSDQARCRASCGDDARLYFHPVNQLEVDNATDSSGRTYRLLTTAFLYRKRQVGGCQCRPEPWSTAELNRHRRYGEIAEGETRRPDGAAAIGQASAETASDLDRAAVADGAPAVGETPSQPMPRVKPSVRIRSATKAPSVRVKVPQDFGPKPIRLPQQVSAPLLIGGGMGLGGGKMPWPGDPIRR